MTTFREHRSYTAHQTHDKLSLSEILEILAGGGYRCGSAHMTEAAPDRRTRNWVWSC